MTQSGAFDGIFASAMRTGSALLVTVVLCGVCAGAAGACDDKPSDAGASTIPSAPPRETAAPPMPKPAPMPDRWDELELTCDKVLPTALRNKLGLTGWVSKEIAEKGTLSCAFADPKAPSHLKSFKYECRGHPSERATGPGLQAMTLAFHSMAKDARDLTGLGRVAMQGTTIGVAQLWILDDKTPCRVNLMFGMRKAVPTEEQGHAVMDQFQLAAAP